MLRNGGCEGNSDRHTLINLFGCLEYSTVLRFYFECENAFWDVMCFICLILLFRLDSLLREKVIDSFLSDERRFYTKRAIISAGSNGLNTIVDVGTFCSYDPASLQDSKVLRRQKEVSGREHWSFKDLKCKFLDRNLTH